MGQIDHDDLGEVENLSIFEKYPEAFKRLSILFGSIFVIVFAIYALTNREVAADCLNAPVAVLHEEVCHGDMFCIREMRSAQCVEFWAEKKPGGADIGLLIKPYREGLIGFAETEYLVLQDGPPRRLTQFQIPEGASEDDWKAYLSVTPQFQAPTAEPVTNIYAMPLDPNRGYRVLQASDKLTDHAGMLEYAVDFAVSAGTPVRAMRDGFVVGMRMEQQAGGERDAAYGHENYIWIQHLDGTVATYRHLLKDSQQIDFGDAVVAGQEIALSGASGYVTQPMLHVHVSTPLPDGTGFKTFPMRFQTTEGNVEVKSFQVYRPSF
jgi:NAD-dependent dihydropyrimidine dehydrogenase PreA subunit